MIFCISRLKQWEVYSFHEFFLVCILRFGTRTRLAEALIRIHQFLPVCLRLLCPSICCVCCVSFLFVLECVWHLFPCFPLYHFQYATNIAGPSPSKCVRFELLLVLAGACGQMIRCVFAPMYTMMRSLSSEGIAAQHR